MTNTLRSIGEEAKRHFLELPPPALNVYQTPPSYQSQIDSINAQILAFLEEKEKRPIFIIAPQGGGKTTHIQHFMKAHPEFHYLYKSYIQIDSFDFAFLHLTQKKLRYFFLVTAMVFSYLVFPLLPGQAIGPIMVLLIFSLMKTFGHFFYLIHEMVDNFFTKDEKIFIIEDLEKSLIQETQRWEFLTGLWQYKRKYIITLSYPLAVETSKKRLEFIENAIKLGGRIIELVSNEKANYEMLKALDPEFPFILTQEPQGWLSLFTFREIAMLHEQLAIKIQVTKHISKQEKQFLKVELVLTLLLDKVELRHQEFIFDKTKKELKKPPQDKLNTLQIHYLNSFCTSVIPELGISVV